MHEARSALSSDPLSSTSIAILQLSLRTPPRRIFLAALYESPSLLATPLLLTALFTSPDILILSSFLSCPLLSSHSKDLRDSKRYQRDPTLAVETCVAFSKSLRKTADRAPSLDRSQRRQGSSPSASPASSRRLEAKDFAKRKRRGEVENPVTVHSALNEANYLPKAAARTHALASRSESQHRAVQRNIVLCPLAILGSLAFAVSRTGLAMTNPSQASPLAPAPS